MIDAGACVHCGEDVEWVEDAFGINRGGIIFEMRCKGSIDGTHAIDEDEEEQKRFEADAERKADRDHDKRMTERNG
jgi:hypothetical protein